MKVYLASRFSNRAQTDSVRLKLLELGIEVTSRWTHDPKHCDPNFGISLLNYELATEDKADIDAADAVVYMPPGGRNGGCHFECGYAFGLGKRLIWIGTREHIFSYLPEVQHFNTVAEFLDNYRTIQVDQAV